MNIQPIKREYYPLTDTRPTIGVVMMVKNEKKRLHVTLESIKDYADCLIVYDTGSTDNTIQIFTDFCETNKLNLYLIQGEFVDFSTSRNVVLDYADTIPVKFLLLMDCNDELRGGKKLKAFAAKRMSTPNTGYLISQHWWSGQYDKYYNIRFVKNKAGWRYKGSVHEWLYNKNTGKADDVHPAVRIEDEEIFLYQDRTQDDDKTGKRFHRDYELLLSDYKRDPVEPRTLFYLAQTCSCLGKNAESFYYYKLRSELEGFQEEKFHSFLRCGDISKILKHSWVDTMGWYMKAVEHSDRVEPLLQLGQHYLDEKKWKLAYGFIKMACETDYPYSCILWVDKRAYDYKRWHMMGIVGYYVEKYKDGEEGCRKAIAQKVNVKLDTSNLEFYLNKTKEKEGKENKGKKGKKEKKEEKENKIEIKNTVTKKEFIAQQFRKIKNEFPKMNDKQIKMKANLLWKRRRKH